MKYVLSAALALLLNLAVLAAPPTLTLPATVTASPGAFATVAATTTGKQVAWIVLDPGLNLFPVSMLKDTHTAVVTSGTPGSYRLLAVTAAGDEISSPAICTVIIQTREPPAPPAPAPNPPPAPTPPTPPAPTGKAAWAVVVIDNNSRTPAQGQLISSVALIQALQQRGVTLRVLDANDPLVKSLNYGPAVTAAGGAPALLVFTAAGQRLKAIALPANETSFLAAVPTPPAASCPSGTCPLLPSSQVNP